ncbi:MAG: threonine synthase [Coprobacillus sp.]|nr:threonine synthase [Coprobacillus sp.]MDY4145123.1 threonine synthase [Bacilli bacterium]
MYKSTRGLEGIHASKAIIDGIASDGGLYVTDIDFSYSQKDFDRLKKLSYKDLAVEILEKFLDDFTKEEITDIVYKSYDKTFDIDSIVNVKKAKDKIYFLELFHGKTLAFKDVALQVLPNLLSVSKKKNNINEKTIILTATSGDTGSAALAGFEGKEDVEMIVLYPNQGVSEIQEKQMLQYESKTRHIYAVEGNFDDCQNLVKKIFSEENNKNLSSANSINIGRLIPQIVYYFYAYFRIARKKEKINVVVPTGNFGDILAGYMAKEMGLPIEKLICASNQNNVLEDFIRTGVYDINRPFKKSISPSMDILISSNLERLLYYKLKDCKVIKELMSDLKNKKVYEVHLDMDEFVGESISELETFSGIRSVYDYYDYVIDPHTSVAYGSFRKYQTEHNREKNKVKTLILSTAHPMKFSKTVSKVFGFDFEDENEAIDFLEKELKVKKPEQLKNLKKNKKTILSIDDASKKIKSIIKECNNG